MHKHTMYGVKMVHPMDCMMRDFISTLPHETGESIDFLHSRAAAHHYAQLHGKEAQSLVATQTKYGHDMQQQAVLPAVAIVYEVACPDDIYQQLKTSDIMISPSKVGPLTGMEIHPIEAYIQNDPLHNASRYSLYEVGAEIERRWNDYHKLNIALRHSTPEQLQCVDFNNLLVQGSLRLMYSEGGRIDTNFFTSHSHEDHLRSIERVMYQGHVGVGYMLHLLEMENQYQDTYHKLTEDGYSREYAAAAAAKEMATTLCHLSKMYNDPHTAQHTFAPLVEAYNLDACVHTQDDQPDHPFIEPTDDEIDLFE